MDRNNTISILELERQILEKEGFRIIFRVGCSTLTRSYDYIRQSPSKMNLSKFIESRIIPLVGNIDFEILDGRALVPTRRTTLGTLRNSYNV